MTDQRQPADGDNADHSQRWLDDLDPGLVAGHDATHFRRIVEAKTRLAAADQALREAISDAREGGDSWTVIAAALGLTPSQARDRFEASDEKPPQPDKR